MTDQVREGVWMCGVARVKWCAAVAHGRAAVEYGSLEREQRRETSRNVHGRDE
jgi:hypothetical protein